MNQVTAQAESLWRIFLALPITTQYAVTLLLVSGLIVHLFKHNERTVHEAASVFTTAGIFFTFLAIAEGLYAFDTEKIDASIPALLDSLKTAFVAAVVGVGIALTLKIRYAFFGVRKRGQPTLARGATVEDLYNQMGAVQQALVGDDDSTLLSQIKLTREDSNDRLDKLRQSQTDFIKQMADNNSKALIEAVKEVIPDVNTKTSEQFGDNFKQLNEAVGWLLEWQNNYQIQLSEAIQQQTQTAQNMKIATERYEAVVGYAETFTATARQLSQLLSGLETQRTQLDGSLKSMATLLMTASQSLPQVEAKIVQLTEQVTAGVKFNSDEMTRTVRDTGMALQGTVTDLKGLLLETLQSTNRQIGDHMKQLAEKTNEHMAKLDLALETELSKSIAVLRRNFSRL